MGLAIKAKHSIAPRLALSALLLLAIPELLRAASGETQFLTEIRQLIFEGKRSGEGYFSPDGQNLIFQSEREPENPSTRSMCLISRPARRIAFRPGLARRRAGSFGQEATRFYLPRHTRIPKRVQK